MMESKHKLKIKEILEIKKMSQYELCKLTGLSKGYISALLDNKKNPTLKVLLKIAESLEVCPQDLFKCPKNCNK